MTGDLRRQLILSAAKRCFARHGFAGTTTKSVAAAASISEGLLFKHFPRSRRFYAEILAEACEADPALHRLLELEPSTETLVVLIREMVRHFQQCRGSARSAGSPAAQADDQSHLDDGEFARLCYEKIGDLIGPVFTASLERAVAAGDATRVGTRAAEPVLVRPSRRADGDAVPTAVGSMSFLRQRRQLERQLCEFILRGIGLNETAIASHLDRELARGSGAEGNRRKCMT